MSLNVKVDYEVRQGDYGTRPISVRAKDPNGTIVTLPSGTTATFRMVGRRSGHVVTGAAVVSGNTLTYTLVDGDTDVVDIYDAVFIAVFPGGLPETYPTCSEPPGGFTVGVCAAI